jgi:hypothetical protein
MNKRRKWVTASVFIYCMSITLAGRCLFAQDPLVRWTFDEPAGGMTNALDTGSGAATTGMLGPTATRTTDTPGGGPGFALDLSDPSAAGANTSIVDGGNPIEVDTLAQFTMSTWVKVTSETDYNEGGSGNVRLLAKQSGGLFDGFSWNMNLPQQGSARSNNAFATGMFIGGQNGFKFSFSSEDILDRGGEWLFLAVTYDGTTTDLNTNFYIGDETTPVSQLGETVLVDSGTILSTNVANGGAMDARFAVGLTDGAPAADTSVTGFQDDIRVYDRILDLEELDTVRLANLQAPMVLNGDYNDNGAVDAADYALWRDNLGMSITLPNESATPGMVTTHDYDVWRANFGAASPGLAAASSVPEPQSMALFVAGLLISAAAISARRS